MTPEPISPELALVDPDLAARARALLPVHAVLDPAVPERVPARHVDAPPPDPSVRELPTAPTGAPGPAAPLARPLVQHVYSPTPPRPSSRMLRRRTLARLTTVIASSVALNVVLVHELVNTSRATGGTSTVEQPGPQTPAPRGPDAGPAGPGGPFTWEAVPGAVYYDFVLWDERGARRVLDLFPVEPTVRGPLRSGGRPLPAGTYRWYVYPATGSREKPVYGPVTASGEIRADGRS